MDIFYIIKGYLLSGYEQLLLSVLHYLMIL